jgi:flotillin
MAILLILIVAVIAAAIVIAFLQRFYRKATRERALIRTGAGGKAIGLDGGFIALPFLHKVEEINMRTMRLEFRTAEKSLMIDIASPDTEMESTFASTRPSSVATAAQALGARRST